MIFVISIIVVIVICDICILKYEQLNCIVKQLLEFPNSDQYNCCFNLIAIGCIEEAEYVDNFSWSTDVTLQKYNTTLK